MTAVANDGHLRDYHSRLLTFYECAVGIRLSDSSEPAG